MSKSESLRYYLEGLQRLGQYSFAKTDAAKVLQVSDSALKLSLNRLGLKKRIAQIRRGFYVIVPIEYSANGILPAEWFIDDLMRFTRQPYYVGLLSAAGIHGVAPQQPQEFQVVCPISLRSIQIGRLRIRFFKKKDMERAPSEQAKTATGFMRISGAPVTMLDLVGYSRQLGGFGAVSPLIQELSETVSPSSLIAAAEVEPNLAFVQRLGFVLERFGRDILASELSRWLRSKKPRWSPLDPSAPRKGFPRNNRWLVIENTETEVAA